MRFHTKLILTYSTLVAVLALAAGLVVGRYNTARMEEGAVRDLRLLSENASRQLDEVVRPMEFITEFLMSDAKTLDAVMTLSNVERSELNSSYINQARIDIKGSLITYCIDENFHRVNVFSRSGDFLTSNIRRSSVRDGYADYLDFPYIDRVDAAMGRVVLTPPHADTWDLKDPLMVFSLVRVVMGVQSPSYLEVQKPYSVLEGIYRYEESHIHMLAINGLGEVLYSTMPTGDTSAVRDLLLADDAEEGARLYRLDDDIVAAHYSPYTGVYSVAVQGSESVREATVYIFLTTFGVVALVCALSILFISITSQKLTAPIRQLTAQMERTNLENMGDNVELARPNDEIARLGTTYNGLMRRLEQAVHREKQLSTLQIQAEFDALQAQVNPHFLYNILNVISHRGVLDGDETICDICERLAAMLRYSTGTSQREVTIREELDYVGHYLYLLGTRYRDKLVCEIDVDPAIEEGHVPKIVLQQIVENAVNHGFRDTVGEMRIQIRGWLEDGYWYLQVRDNGGGFDEGALAKLWDSINRVCQQVLMGNQRPKLEIGGMGLVNSYARMALVYGWNFVFEPSNNEDGCGATVLIGAAMKHERGEWDAAHHSCCGG